MDQSKKQVQFKSQGEHETNLKDKFAILKMAIIKHTMY